MFSYYNLLDYEHRKFLRVLADRFGIHGFVYYHYWFKDRPVMHKPLELMRIDFQYVTKLTLLIELWQSLCIMHGIPKIYFMKFLGPFSNTVLLNNI